MSVNIFEVINFPYKFSKLVNFQFISLEKTKTGKYYSYTSKWDIVRLIIGIVFVIWNFYYLSNNSFTSTSRSIIFDIGMYMSSKFEIVHPALIMLQTFHYRYEYFHILNGFHYIDEKVRKFI